MDSLTPAQISPVRVDLKDPPSPAVCEQRLADHDIHGKTCPGADRVVRDRSKASRTRCTKCPCGKIDFEGLWFWVGDLRSSWWTFTPATRVFLASRRFAISAFAISAAIWFWNSNDLYSISSSSLPRMISTLSITIQSQHLSTSINLWTLRYPPRPHPTLPYPTFQELHAENQRANQDLARRLSGADIPKRGLSPKPFLDQVALGQQDY